MIQKEILQRQPFFVSCSSFKESATGNISPLNNLKTELKKKLNERTCQKQIESVMKKRNHKKELIDSLFKCCRALENTFKYLHIYGEHNGWENFIGYYGSTVVSWCINLSIIYSKLYYNILI